MVQCHNNQGKKLLVHTPSSIGQQIITPIIIVAAIYGFYLWSQYIPEAHRQSWSILAGDIYVKPKEGFTIRSDQMLKLLKALYDMIDSSEYWHTTTTHHIKEDMEMQQSTGELVCFMKCGTTSSPSAFIELYFVDSISTGNGSSEEDSNRTGKKFKARSSQYDSFTYAGINVEKQVRPYSLHPEH